MNLQSYFEKDRERFVASLKQASTPEKAIPVIESEYDRILYEYNEQCEEDYERRCAAMILQSARMTAPLIDSFGEIKIWEQGGKLLNDEKKKVDIRALILLIAGIALTVVSVIVLGGSDTVLNKCLSVAHGRIPCKESGLFFRKKTKAVYSEKQLKAEPHIDAEKVYRTMHAVLLVADRNIADALSARRMEEESKLQDPVESKADLSFYSDLLEASLAKDGEYALDQISKVPFYLHQKGIEAVEYRDDIRSWFDVIPGERHETIRPALVKDGRLLKKGIVSGDY